MKNAMITTLRALLLGMITLAYAADALPAWTMSDAERREIETLADQAVAMGMPDTSHAELHVGTLTVTWPKADGSGEEQRNFQGIHAKQPDGTWVPNLFQRLADIKGLTIQRNGLKPIAVQELPILARQKHGDWRYWIDDPINVWSPRFSPESLAMIHGAESGIDLLQVNRTQIYDDLMNPFSLSAATCVALIRMHVPGAVSAAVGVGGLDYPIDVDALKKTVGSTA